MTDHTKRTKHLTLITGAERNGQALNLTEMLAKAILDTACTNTAAGKTWMNEYFKMLSKQSRKEGDQNSRATKSLCQFGDTHEEKGSSEIVIPVLICNKKMKVSVDVVDSNIP